MTGVVFQVMSMTQLKVYALSESALNRPITVLLSMIFRLERDFWFQAVNGGLLILCLGWTGLRWLHQGDVTAVWLPAQMVLIPVLMAVEEFMHMAVAVRKGISHRHVDLVIMKRTGRNGFPWLCCGAAARYRETILNRDRIHIAAPGPVLSLILLVLVWLICGLLDGHLWWGRAHRTALPILGYLAGAWLPLPAVLTPDVTVILRAAREERFSPGRLIRECVRGMGLMWRRRVKESGRQQEAGRCQHAAVSKPSREKAVPT